MYLSKYYITHRYPDGKEIILNTLSGTITPFKSELCSLEKARFIESCLKEEDIRILKQAGLLFKRREEEEHLIRYWRDRKEKEWESEPVAHVIYLSYNCNLQCTYCCYTRLRDRKRVMEFSDIDKIMEMIEKIQAETGRNSRICLFGGEPLLKSSYRLVEYALSRIKRLADKEEKSGRQCRIMIFTNGVELPYYKELLESYKEYIEHILVTLIGTRSIHDSRRVFGDGQGSYERVIEGINRLLTTGIPTWAVTNIDRTNLDELSDNIKLIQERGWNHYKNFKGYYFGRIKYYDQKHQNAVTESELLREAGKRLAGDEAAQQLYNFGDMRLLKAIKNFYLFATDQSSKTFHTLYGCSSGNLSQYSYDADGALYTCSGAMGIEGYEIGAYSPFGIVDQEKSQWWTGRNVQTIEKCRDCPMAFLCGGGCAYAAKEINGSEYLPCCTDAENLMHIYLDCMYQGLDIRYRDLLRE